jgi:hypothetical protein
MNNLLDIWGLVDPNRILVKGKLHVLSHTPEDARRFGPCIIFATEIFECWNTIFRLCSILSNHLSPSHDIATTLGDMERFKHMVSGGWWQNSVGKYIRAGSSVRSFLTSNRELQRRLGWSERTILPSGTLFTCVQDLVFTWQINRNGEVGSCQETRSSRVELACARASAYWVDLAAL